MTILRDDTDESWFHGTTWMMGVIFESPTISFVSSEGYVSKPLNGGLLSASSSFLKSIFNTFHDPFNLELNVITEIPKGNLEIIMGFFQSGILDSISDMSQIGDDLKMDFLSLGIDLASLKFSYHVNDITSEERDNFFVSSDHVMIDNVLDTDDLFQGRETMAFPIKAEQINEENEAPEDYYDTDMLNAKFMTVEYENADVESRFWNNRGTTKSNIVRKRDAAKKGILRSCDKCNFKATDQKLMKRHLRIHKHDNLKKKYNCPKCKTEFTFKYELKAHNRENHQDDTIDCECGREFPPGPEGQKLLDEHLTKHICIACGQDVTKKLYTF